MTDIILVHSPCQDGYTAELCARLYYKRVNPAQPFEVWGLEPNRDTCQQDIMRRIKGFLKAGNTARSIRCFDLAIAPVHANTLVNGLACTDVEIYDHHLTFKTIWDEYKVSSPEYYAKWAQRIHYDVEHCGAYLAWMYYFPAVPVPKYILYVQDRDLWKFTQPDSVDINESLYVLGRTLSTHDDWLGKFFEFKSPTEEDACFKSLCETGKQLSIAKLHRLECLYKNGFRINFEGYNTFSCNASHMDASDLGNYAVTRDYQAALLWRFDGKTKRINVSVRSNNTSGQSVDVAKLCSKYGGGGHKHAAGFELDPKDISLLLYGTNTTINSNN